MYIFMYLWKSLQADFVGKPEWTYRKIFLKGKKYYSAVLSFEVFIKTNEGFVSTPVSKKIYLLSALDLPEANGNLHPLF